MSKTSRCALVTYLFPCFHHKVDFRLGVVDFCNQSFDFVTGLRHARTRADLQSTGAIFTGLYLGSCLMRHAKNREISENYSVCSVTLEQYSRDNVIPCCAATTLLPRACTRSAGVTMQS